jgi:hypothetical protein
MKKLSMKTLITFSIAFLGLFGIVRAEEVVTETSQPVVSVTGELSTDITFGDATTFTSPYTGLVFSGGGEEDEDTYWATNVSYGFSLSGIDSKFGLSLNSNEAQLLDVSVNSNIFETSLEYDLSEEADGAYWARGVVKPSTFQGAFLLIGYNSDEVVTYGVGYKCSDNMKVVSEFTSGLKDTDGNEVENDFAIRASYSF